MPAPRDFNWSSKLTEPPAPMHGVSAYRDDAQLVDFVARFVGVGLVHGDGVVMFVTDRHRDAIQDRLTEVGFHLDVAQKSGQLHVHDARQMLERLLVDGAPSRERFRRLIGEVLAGAAGRGRRRFRVFGEMLDLCWQAGDVASAFRLEGYWTELQRERPLDVLLSYARANEFREALTQKA
jgi:hypothetical protein